jgi:serine/threonine protein kinase
MCDCPAKELVERYLIGGCSNSERQDVEEHLDRCDGCRELVESTRSNMLGGAQPGSGRGEYKFGGDGEETEVIREDERPTETTPEATVVPDAQRSFTKSIESMIGGYTITEALPRGGQAVVYKAIHTATKTYVAIKVLLPTLLASERARYYFEREAELIASLDHPNIVSIRDSGLIHGQYYFVMQYIEGEPLRRYVQEKMLSFRERVELVNKICSAITYAHQQGVIHRDLKFANILVDKRGEPHILDFGLAKAVGMSEQAKDDAVVTMTGQWAGSLTTMSPEQAAGQPHLIDVRTDVYSLGVILYTLLTGQYPYDVSGTTLEALRTIQQVEPTRPRQVIPKFNSEMEAILLTALDKERQKRYQSAADLKSDIENWLEGRPIRVKSISTMYLLRKIITRHRYTSTVVALLALIVLGFAYISFELLIRSEKALDESQALAKDYAAQAKNTAYQIRQSRPLFFAIFLEAWRDGRTTDAVKMADYFLAGHKEGKAATFLLARTEPGEREESFRKQFSEEDVWFADTIIGERYFRAGNLKKALEAYERGYRRIEQASPEKLSDLDKLMVERVKARLYELRDEGERADAGPGGPDK